jgi:putative ABC transport system substrate-binding protein
VVKKIFTILFFLILFPGVSEAGPEIVAIQSIRVEPYEEAIKGFQSVCNARINRIVVSELGETDVVSEINEIRPDMVLAIGRDALSMVKRIEGIPIVYLMVLNPQSTLSGEKNITGVSMNIPPEKQLMVLLGALPYTKNIGLLYDPNRTGYLVRKAKDAARKIGIKLIAREIHSSRDAPSLIMDMKEKIDVFWMLPDITVITPETVKFLLLFSLENNIPLLAFSEKYVEVGAFMSTDIDAFDMGSQAGEMANKILSGRGVKNVRQVHARKLVVSTNLMIARKLGINLNIAMNLGTDNSEKIIREAQMVN